MADSQVNLSELIGQNQHNHKYDVRLNNEPAEDADARRVQEAKDADLRRKKGLYPYPYPYPYFVLPWHSLRWFSVAASICLRLAAQTIKNGQPAS